MTSIDWKIHKKLLDAGGLGPVVYIWPARASGKLSAEREKIERLLKEGRTVVCGRPGKPTRGITFTGVLLDFDILTPERYERAERIWNEFWKGKKNGTENDM